MNDVAALVEDAAGSPPDDRPNRRERRTRETRRAILDAARHLFENDGYAQTTIEHISVRADVAPRTFFRYFPNKESLLFAEFDEVRRAVIDSLEQRPEGEDPLESLAITLAEYAEVIDRRMDDLVWGFRMCAENQVEGVYERSLIKEQMHARIATFLAERLGVDPDLDPRPQAWTAAAMGVFGIAVRSGAEGGAKLAAVDVIDRFEELLTSTAAALQQVADHLPHRD